MTYDFSGWATKNNVLCADGRTIRKDAFKHNDGCKVPLVWAHKHDSPCSVLGHALLKNKDEGVYCYCSFNESEEAQAAKESVKHGDIVALSIFANHLKHQGSDVTYGDIKEVSLVLAGANPKAFIDSILSHGEETDMAYIYTGENLVLEHSDHKNDDDDSKKEDNTDDQETIKDIFDSMTDKQKKAVYAIVGAISRTDDDTDSDDSNIKHDDLGGNDEMKHNIFDQNDAGGNQTNVISHSDQMDIIQHAKDTGSFRKAMRDYLDDNSSLEHSFNDVESLFPDYKNLETGAPDKIQNDNSWVHAVISKVHKSPMSRVRTLQADIRSAQLRASGYQKGNKKKLSKLINLLKRTTDPQTVYVKDALNRDDIVDITDFDYIEYMYGVMKDVLNEEVASAILIGDGRDESDEDKIFPDKIRPIYGDDTAYTIYANVDIDAAREELQGSDTSKRFGENYILAEAFITAALYAREQYKGKGTPDLFIDPHMLNVMLLARDLNGRRVYNTKTELATALDAENIYTVEKFSSATRSTKDGTKSLLGLFVNLNNYNVGSTKGGEITKFNQFDIDFNQEKMLIETRLSGALAKAYSAIALEMPVTASSSHDINEDDTI